MNYPRKCDQRRASFTSIACIKQPVQGAAAAIPRAGFKAVPAVPTRALLRTSTGGTRAAETLPGESGAAEPLIGACVPQAPLKETLAGSAMHRLCQPLTALQCILELGMDHEDVDDLRATMADSARECARAIAMVRVFRDLLELGRRYAAGARRVDARRTALDHGFAWRPDNADLRGARSGLSEVPFIRVNSEGLDYVFRELGLAFASIGVPQVSQTSSSGASLAAFACPRVEKVCFAWRLTPSGGEKWLRECVLGQPFDVPDFDFARNSVPHLAAARMVAEAMGATFLCGEAGVDIEFPKASVLKSSRPQEARTTARFGSVAAAG
ncbi:MAG: hypothetical protein ACYCSN_00975 [Acidobacteriaceae bacterium]